MKYDNKVNEQLLVRKLESEIGKDHQFSQDYIKRKQDFIDSISDNDVSDIKQKVNNSHNEKITYVIKNKIKTGYIKTVAAALVLVMLIPVSVLAAEKLINYYDIYIKRTGNYSYDIGMSEGEVSENNTAANLFHTSVKIDISDSLKEHINGYVQTHDGGSCKFDYSINDENMDVSGTNEDYRGISIMLIGLNEGEDIRVKNVTETKELDISGKKAVWFKHNGIYTNDVFILYSDYGYAVEIKAQLGITDDELTYILDGICLMTCDSENAASANYRIYRDEYTDENVSGLDGTKEDMEEYRSTEYRTGDKFYLPEVYMYSSNSLEYCIKDYYITDSPDDTLEYSDKQWISSVISSDGIFKTYKRPQNYNLGDGINSIYTVESTVEMGLKLVIADISVTNTGNEDIEAVRLLPQICCLYADDGKLMIPQEMYSNGFINSEGYPVGATFTSSLGIVRGVEDCSRTSVKAGESISIKAGYLVDEDRLDNMVLFYNSYGKLGEQKGHLAVIRL